MAKKVQPQPVDILPAPSSSDDETEDHDGSSSETDDEKQPQHPPQSQKPQNQQPQNEEEEESEDDSDDETEDDEPVSKPEPVVKKPSLPEPQKSEESDDGDESNTESDETENSPTASGFTVKPIVSKSPEPKTPTSKPARVKSRAKRPADSEETDKASKPVSKNQEPGKGKGGNGKRAAEVEKVSKSKKSKVGEGQSVGKVEKDSKSKKGVSGDDESGEVEEKKSIIKWSEKDEVALLGGIIDYKVETGEDVNSKVDTFYEYAKDLLSVSLTKSQLYEKIRRLKKKFQTNSEKWQNGEEPVFSKPHESKLFELSQKIWGSEGTVIEGNDSKVKTSKKKDKKDGNVVSNTSTPLKPDTSRELFVQEEIKDTIMEDKKEETKDFWSLYPMLCASLESEASGYLTLELQDLKEYVKGIVSGIGEEKARELEDGWKAVHAMDHQLYARRAFMISKQAEAAAALFN